MTTIPIPTSPNLISVFLTFPSQVEIQGRINVECLLDTGCLGIVEKCNTQPILQSTSILSFCSGLDNTCYDKSKSIIVSVNFLMSE